jgi:hypothetical protein
MMFNVSNGIRTSRTGASRYRCVWLALAVVAFVVGCRDKAQPDYDECLKLEAKWDAIGAQAACEKAVQADPNSNAGKAAAAKLAALKEAADKERATKAAAEPKPCKAGKWVTRCIWKGKPRPTLLEGPTAAKCNQDAGELATIEMSCPACVCADDYKDPPDLENQ